MKLHRIVAVVVAALPITLHAAAPVADIELERDTCFAPCDVFFDARATRDPDLGADWEPLLDLTYRWDFGDPDSGFWTQGATLHSKNIDTGFVAGHVYESPGTYSATLEVSDSDGEVDIATISIHVKDPDSVFESARTHCISARSNFEGCPEGATTHTSDDFDEALGELCDVDESANRCLFRRGEIFVADRTTHFLGDNAFLVGAFGTGSDPLVSMSVPNVTLFNRLVGSAQKVVMDLDLLGKDLEFQRFFDMADQEPLQWFLVLRVDALNLQQFGCAYAGTPLHAVPDDMPHHLSIVDSSSLSAAFNSADLFTFAERLMFMGNDFTDKDSDQHVIRIGWTDGAVLSHNDLGGNCGEIRHVLKVHNAKAGDLGNTACTRDLFIADNLILGCLPNDFDVEIGPNAGRGEECVERFVVERNHFRVDGNLDKAHRSLVVTVGPASIRSNIFDLSGGQTGANRGVTIWQKTSDQIDYTMPDDIRVVGNSCTADADTIATPRCVEINGPNVDRPVVKNNVLHTPDGSGSVVSVQGGDPQEPTWCADGSIESCNLTLTESPFVASPKPYPTEDFRPSSDSPLLAAGDCQGFESVDMDLTERTVPVCTAGAFEALPEPGSALALAAGACQLVALSRRRRRAT